jgi:hypothetical protein
VTFVHFATILFSMVWDHRTAWKEGRAKLREAQHLFVGNDMLLYPGKTSWKQQARRRASSWREEEDMTRA